MTTLAANIQVTAPLVGGVLIGAAAATLLLFNGQVAGISGVVGRIVEGDFGQKFWRVAFLIGLLLSGPAYLYWNGALPPFEISADLPTLIVAGLLVGFGTRVGSGCTSGHGVCGIANFSPRSLTATVVFMAVAIVVVFLVRHAGVSL